LQFPLPSFLHCFEPKGLSNEIFSPRSSRFSASSFFKGSSHSRPSELPLFYGGVFPIRSSVYSSIFFWRLFWFLLSLPVRPFPLPKHGAPGSLPFRSEICVGFETPPSPGFPGSFFGSLLLPLPWPSRLSPDFNPFGPISKLPLHLSTRVGGEPFACFLRLGVFIVYCSA